MNAYEKLGRRIYGLFERLSTEGRAKYMDGRVVLRWTLLREWVVDCERELAQERED